MEQAMKGMASERKVIQAMAHDTDALANETFSEAVSELHIKKFEILKESYQLQLRCRMMMDIL